MLSALQKVAQSLLQSARDLAPVLLVVIFFQLGATGATVITSARGEGLVPKKTFLGLDLVDLRDVVLLVVEEHLSARILQKVASVGCFDTEPGSGVAIQLAVEETIGLGGKSQKSHKGWGIDSEQAILCFVMRWNPDLFSILRFLFVGPQMPLPVLIKPVRRMNSSSLSAEGWCSLQAPLSSRTTFPCLTSC